MEYFIVHIKDSKLTIVKRVFSGTALEPNKIAKRLTKRTGERYKAFEANYFLENISNIIRIY